MSKKLRFLSLVLAIVMLVSSAPVVPVYAQGETSLSEITNPFTSDTPLEINGQTVTSKSYRIPAMVTLADGTIVAAADIRWNTTYDGGGLDTLVARSTDGGATWSYKVANYLGDNGNVYNGSQSTAFLDPSLVVAADGKTVYMLVDLYPYGVALNGSGHTNPSTDVGFNNQGKLLLSGDDHASYSYYLDGNKIYNSTGTVVDGYTVDEKFNITGSNGMESNLFFEDSPFKVVRTGYLYLTSSADGGASWSAPTLLNNIKTNSEQACLVAPGSSITTGNGTMIFPVYSFHGDNKPEGNTQRLSFIYSKDGVNWSRTEELNHNWASEAAVVELQDGTLRFFIRNGSQRLQYVDYTMDSGWSTVVTMDNVKTNSNTQISAITYSRTVNGEQVILVSCPTGPDRGGSYESGAGKRLNGSIFVFTVNAAGEMTLKNTLIVNDNDHQFMYSCLTERADGSVAILYEEQEHGWGVSGGNGESYIPGEVTTYYTMDGKSYSSDAFGITFDSNEIVSREKDGVTVTGYIPNAVELQVAGVSDAKLNAVSNGLIDKSGFSEILSISGKDITLLDGNANKPWHPGADRPVTVTVSDVWTPAGKTLPVVDVYHILDDADAVSRAQAGGYLLTCKDPAVLALYPQEAALLDGAAVPYIRLPGIYGGTVVNQDGSITFETDSFSDYFIVLGFTEGLSLSNNGNDTYYVEPGTTLTFNRSVTWTPQGTVPNGITASGNTITIGSSVMVPSEVIYEATWTGFLGFGGGTANITIKVVSRRELISNAFNDTDFPVILSVVQGITTIPSEPGHSSGDYYQFGSDYTSNSQYPPNKFISTTANGIINPDISDMLTKSIDNSNTIGYADATGVTILRNLSGIDWDRILERAVNQKWKAIDGTTITDANKNLYKIVPYVIKLMDGANYSGKGWHIDCAIVLKDNVTLSYDMNLDNYQVSGTLKLPNTASGIPNPTFGTSVGSIAYGSSNLNVGSTIRATYNGEQMTLTFMGWNTSPDGKGTMYTPGAAISIAEDTVLYAIWEGELVPGELYIYKTVTAEDGATEPSGATYQFNVQFGTAGTYSYTVYNADGSTVSSGFFNTQGTIDLANGQYAVFTGVPANTTYTVTETPGSYTTTAEGDNGVVRSGGRAVARFINHYAYTEPEVTINYIAKDGGSVTRSSETVKVNTGNALGSTANPSDGYQFAGWFQDEACTQPVDQSWITSGNHLVPQKEDGSYQDATYYAKFVSAVTSLTISKTGHSNIDENQSFLFRVEGEGVNLVVTVHGNGFTKIDGLKVGNRYTVTELTEWSWRYDFSEWVFVSDDTTGANGTENAAAVTLGTDGNKITFTNTRDENKWLDGDTWADNGFKS